MVSLSEAIDNKYGDDVCETPEFDLPVEIFVPRKNPLKSIPSLLVLNDCDIHTAGDEQEIEEKCQTVEDLDLAQNKLEQWQEVFRILNHMPRLRFVNLSFNRLQNSIATDCNQNPFPYLKNLILNGTLIEWRNVRTLLRLLPSLEELHLSRNNYSYIDLDAISYCTVKKLHFLGNQINNWPEVCKLGAAFPNLECLVLAECPVQSLEMQNCRGSSPGGRTESESETCEQGESAHTCFKHLKFLNLNNTLISSWEDIDRLSNFPSLRQLRIQGCPLFEEHTEHGRQFLIARLPNVEMLNGGGYITEEEREDSERAFIRHYMEKPESDRPDRYNDLITIHGKLDPLVSVDLSPKKTVRITFRYGDITDVRNISVYQTVQELKQKLESFAGISVSKMRLFYLDQDVDQDLQPIMGPEEMKYPTRELYRYSISTGDEIIIESK